MKSYDIVFILECHANVQVLPEVNGFEKFGDPSFVGSTDGGMAACVKRHLSPYVTNLRFNKCSLAFSLSHIPQFSFMCVYVYPVDSMNFSMEDFGILSSEISHWLDMNVTPYIGGDMNARMGDLDGISLKTLKWRYEQNVDCTITEHGRIFLNHAFCYIH